MLTKLHKWRNRRCLARQAGKLQCQEGSQAQELRYEAARYTKLKKHMTKRTCQYKLAKHRQQKITSQLYRQDGIIWQGRKAKTRGIHRGGDEWVAAGVPRQPRGKNKEARKTDRGETHKTQNEWTEWMCALMTMSVSRQLITHIIQSFFVNLKGNVSCCFFSSPTSDKEILLTEHFNSSKIVEETRKLMHNQYEWLFVNLTVHTNNITYLDFNQSVITYTVSISGHKHTQVESKHFPTNHI